MQNNISHQAKYHLQVQHYIFQKDLVVFFSVFGSFWAVLYTIFTPVMIAINTFFPCIMSAPSVLERPHCQQIFAVRMLRQVHVHSTWLWQWLWKHMRREMQQNGWFHSAHNDVSTLLHKPIELTVLCKCGIRDQITDCSGQDSGKGVRKKKESGQAWLCWHGVPVWLNKSTGELWFCTPLFHAKYCNW